MGNRKRAVDTRQIPHNKDFRRRRNCPTSAVHNFGTLPPEALDKVTSEHSLRSWGTNGSTK
jgi:transcriptional regulator NrdR family protein